MRSLMGLTVWVAALSAVFCRYQSTTDNTTGSVLELDGFCPLNFSHTDTLNSFKTSSASVKESLPNSFRFFDPFLKNVTLISLGGTIAGNGSSPTNNTGYESGVLDPLLAFSVVFSGLGGVVNIRLVEYGRFDGKDLDSTQHIEISQLVAKEVSRDDTAGVVVVSGTDGAEVLYTLAYTIDTEKPVVVIGAGQPASSVGSEGPRVLTSAIILAMNPEARGRGVQYISGDNIIPAWRAFKHAPNMFNAFRAQGGGGLGTLNNLKAVYYWPSVPPEYPTFDISLLDPRDGLPQVDILYVYPGVNMEVLQASLDSGVKAIVFICLGDGYWPKVAADKMKEMLEKTPVLVLQASEHGDGTIGVVNVDFGLGAGKLPPRSARVLLQLALVKAHELGLEREVVEDLLAHIPTNGPWPAWIKAKRDSEETVDDTYSGYGSEADWISGDAAKIQIQT